ncbi:MAG: hypothetical protein J0H19_18690 [Rhodospirillales bacterium]|nr:hypothetical protein [Rhodospirillales bacterium]MBN8928643.1 hypothetical protein [Rhodospirillales bacterium]
MTFFICLSMLLLGYIVGLAHAPTFPRTRRKKVETFKPGQGPTLRK